MYQQQILKVKKKSLLKYSILFLTMAIKTQNIILKNAKNCVCKIYRRKRDFAKNLEFVIKIQYENDFLM